MSGADPKAVLLDLDDTILSYSAVADGLWDELAAVHSARAGVPTGRFAAQLLVSRRWFWGDPERNDRGRLDMRGARVEIVAHALAALGVEDEALTRRFADEFTDEREARVVPFPGALAALDRLRERGVPLALLTNGHPEFQRPKIERFDLERRFDAILVEGELGFGKPDARVFQRALDALGARAQDAWMVGDNLRADVAGAQRLGIHAVWVDHRRSGLPDDAPARPDRVIHRIADLPLAR